MTTLTISAGAREYAYLEDDGTFPATLVSFDKRGPFDSKQKPGEQFYLLEWGFSIDDAGDNSMVWATSGEATGPKSKTYGIITALFGGKQPPVGQQLDIEKHLISRRALVTVRRDENGYMKVDAVSALPSAPPKKNAAPVPVADANPDDLPF
jgi:hypothetical protein